MARQSVGVESIRLTTVPSAVQTVQASFEIFLLSIWLGSMLFFSFGVAPSAFSSLPTKQLAALVVTSTLSKVELIGLIAGPLLIISILFRSATASKKRSAATWRSLTLVIVMTAAAALSRYYITPVMVAIRNGLPDIIDRIPAGDPSRIKFDQLHQYSVGLMSVALLAGLVMLFLTVRVWMKR